MVQCNVAVIDEDFSVDVGPLCKAAITIAGTAGTETQHTARTVARAAQCQQWQPLPPPLAPL